MAFYEMGENNCKFANNVSDKGLYPNYVKNPFNSIAKQIAQLKICRGNEETFFFLEKTFKRCSLSLILREMRIKTSMSC